MAKKPYSFEHQLKTFVSLEQKINDLLLKYKQLKNGIPGVLFRVVVEPNSTTLYKDGHQGKGNLHAGVRKLITNLVNQIHFGLRPVIRMVCHFPVHLTKPNLLSIYSEGSRKTKLKLILLIGY